MLRKRLITLLTFVDGVLHRTKLFEPDYRYTQNFIDAWSIDEIIILDVSRPGTGNRTNFIKVVEGFTEKCFVPLTVGGGVRSLEDVKLLMSVGADKVTVNTGAIETPDLISQIAEAYGAQCAVVSMDAKRESDGGYQVYSKFGTTPTGMMPEEWAAKAEKLGAGEILVSSIDQDGSLAGLDLELCRKVTSAVKVPVILSGGAGNWKHFVEGFLEGKADAVCATNIYHFTEKSIQSFKANLDRTGVNVRK